MNEDEAKRAVSDQARVRLVDLSGRTHAVGTVVSYSPVPALTVKEHGGRLITWRHDLAHIIEPKEHIMDLDPEDIISGNTAAAHAGARIVHDEVAAELREFYLGLVRQGFSKDEALTIVGRTFAALVAHNERPEQ